MTNYTDFGQLSGADTSQADAYPDITSSKEADLFFISIGQERYEIPEAIIFGG